MKQPLIVLTGPTAVGKTALSIRLAKAIGGEIVSADSMQVYRHMDIGSAKVTPGEMDGVPHYLIDVLDPRDSFNVVTFQQMAKEALREIYSHGRIPVSYTHLDNINEIEKYKSRDLLITRDQAVDLEPDEYFITDLIGLTVVSDQGAELGTLKDVLETGANDVYVVAMKDGKELMLPAIGDCILNVDLEQGRMEVHVLEGLMDL